MKYFVLEVYEGEQKEICNIFSWNFDLIYTSCGKLSHVFSEIMQNTLELMNDGKI